MSYDLYLYPREGVVLDRQAFFDYFADNDRFEQNEDDVHYSNQDTGVYFHFTYAEGGPDEDEPNRVLRSHIYFNMNFFRPHTFGLEAEPVLTALVQHFDLTVEDPQSEGMGEGEYDREGFLRGWNAGNRFAARAFGEIGTGQDALTLPAEVNRKYWYWNYSRADLLDELSDEEIDVYVPPIWYCREQGQIRTFSLFPNLVPTAVPRVDHVFILRNELPSPHKKKRKETPAWVTWDELRNATTDIGSVREAEKIDNYFLDYLILFNDDYQTPETAPRELARWVIGLPPWPGKPDSVSPDQILDAELLAGSSDGGEDG
jgi:hypothetical protein